MADLGRKLLDKQLLEEDAGFGVLVGRKERQHLGEKLRRALVTKAGKVQHLHGVLGRSKGELFQELGLDGVVLVVRGHRRNDVADKGVDLRVEVRDDVGLIHLVIVAQHQEGGTGSPHN